MTAPCLSVVTPSYNQVGYLRDNLDSVERQMYENVEHIVLDGGSDDGSAKVIESYADRVDYDVTWRSETDDGQSAAINEGFQRATGDIVGWLNSDDVYFDTRVFERVVKAFERTGADVIYGDLAYIDERSKVTEIDVRPDFDRTKLAYRVLIGQPATFFRAEVVKQHQLDTSLQFCMDYEFWLRISEEFDLRHVRDVFAGFRRHEEQKTEDMGATSAETEAMLERYRDSLPERQGNVISENAATELGRVASSLRATIQFHRQQPQLAFDGSFAPLLEMLLNLGPGRQDVTKAWRRYNG